MAHVKIVFLSPCARGHSNIHRTILQFLMHNELPGVSGITLHVAADEPARGHFSDLGSGNGYCSLEFHAIGNTNQLEQFMGNGQESIKKPPPSLTDLSVIPLAAAIVFPPPEGYLERYSNLRKLLEDVNPDLVVVDMLMRAMGVDACKMAGIDNWVVLSPGPSIDVAVIRQPQARGLWYYPR